MSKPNYIYSTLASDTRYAVYANMGNDLPVVQDTVLVKGGAGVADKHFVTPRGVVTQVSDDELAMLEQNKVFQKHVDNGYITVERVSVDVEKVVANMEGRDASAPIVPQDYDAEQAGAKPTDVADAPVKTGGRKRKA